MYCGLQKVTDAKISKHCFKLFTESQHRKITAFGDGAMDTKQNAIMLTSVKMVLRRLVEILKI